LPDAVRKRVASIAIAGTLLTSGILCYFIYVSDDPKKQWMRKIVIDHPAACIDLPICAVIASCTILVLNATSGPIAFEIPGVKLKGGRASCDLGSYVPRHSVRDEDAMEPLNRLHRLQIIVASLADDLVGVVSGSARRV
jgi:hypothetical protein